MREPSGTAQNTVGQNVGKSAHNRKAIPEPDFRKTADTRTKRFLFDSLRRAASKRAPFSPEVDLPLIPGSIKKPPCPSGQDGSVRKAARRLSAWSRRSIFLFDAQGHVRLVLELVLDLHAVNRFECREAAVVIELGLVGHRKRNPS